MIDSGKKVYFYTLGCKVNQYETEAMTELFKKAGYKVVHLPAEADVIVVNSCTVTANSDQKTRQAVRRFKRMENVTCVVLVGCMPQAYPETANILTEADIVTGNRDHKKVLSLVEEFSAKNKSLIQIDPHTNDELFEETQITEFEGRTRAIIKIQDGCNRYCSYCIIPTSRGRSRSRSLESISLELDTIKSKGFKEVVLVGINFCCYGLDIGKTFVDAIELADSKGFERVRIGSLEFDNISDEAISHLAKLKSFCPQFHISLQSGCDTTLKNMNRHYTTSEYKALCDKLRASFVDTSITTDLMVGFPGESEEDFKASLSFAKEIGFEKIHVFPYSMRSGTKAAAIRPQVPGDIKNLRAHEMLKVSEELRQNFLKSQIGRTVEVLCEKNQNGVVTGYTKNYTPVSFRSCENLENELVEVKITSIDSDSCFGEKVCKTPTL